MKSIAAYISEQPAERQKLLSQIHAIIIQEDKKVNPEVELMMGKEMIVYKGAGIFKYGLSGVKNYMSLHAMPIYGAPALHAKYKNQLTKASFQKGCINFKAEEDMPLDIVKQLIADCAKIDLLAIMESYKQSKSAKR